MASSPAPTPPLAAERQVEPGAAGLAIEAVRALARASRLLERVSLEANLAHYRVLSAIASGDERATRIAARLALGKPTVSAAVESLCQHGLLVRCAVVGDLRASSLRLTDEGERVLAEMETAMVAWLAEVCARTPDGDRLPEALAGMGAAIDQMAAERHRNAHDNRNAHDGGNGRAQAGGRQ